MEVVKLSALCITPQEILVVLISVIDCRHVKPRVPPEGHMGHIYVVMRATHDIRPAGRMFDMPDIQYVFFIQNVFYTLK
jgi:hypothetical protein